MQAVSCCAFSSFVESSPVLLSVHAPLPNMRVVFTSKEGWIELKGLRTESLPSSIPSSLSVSSSNAFQVGPGCFFLFEELALLWDDSWVPLWLLAFRGGNILGPKAGITSRAHKMSEKLVSGANHYKPVLLASRPIEKYELREWHSFTLIGINLHRSIPWLTGLSHIS